MLTLDVEEMFSSTVTKKIVTIINWYKVICWFIQLNFSNHHTSDTSSYQNLVALSIKIWLAFSKSCRLLFIFRKLFFSDHVWSWLWGFIESHWFHNIKTISMLYLSNQVCEHDLFKTDYLSENWFCTRFCNCNLYSYYSPTRKKYCVNSQISWQNQ